MEIKVTQRSAIALRGEYATADLLVALRLADDGTPEVIYAGPAAPVWAGPIQSNGQRRVALSTLAGLEGGGLEQVR